MNRVRIRTRVAESRSFISSWSCGARSGEIRIAHPGGPQPLLYAELLALSHLMVDKKLVGINAGVNDIVFDVSVFGLAESITQPEKTPPAVRQYTRALRARFGDAKFEMTDELVERLPGHAISVLASTAPLDWTVKLADTPVIVSAHAVDQVQDRHRFATRGYAYRFITRWAKRLLRPAELPAEVQAEKLNRYPDPGQVLCDDTGWHGVVVNRTLVTMFHRQPATA